VVTDSSFIGVSTQYLVDTAWGQELTVFAQNTHRDVRLVPGAPVLLTWAPDHSFALDASQDIEAGVDVDDEAAAPDPVGVGS
jgi:spermidine/putrescine transport system ATP-binding protein